ncbi:MAG: HK97 family phage prohead protease [Pseudomonadota bacterium]
MPNENERRSLAGPIETRASGDGNTVVGYAALFNTDTEIAGVYTESIAHGAFARAIREDDVRGLFNHNPDNILGRSDAGTLRLSEDSRGLRYEIDLPSTPLGENIRSAIGRGDISQASFMFRVSAESWVENDGELPRRTIQEVNPLLDVSVVTFAAYQETDAALRCLQSNIEPVTRRSATPSHIKRKLRLAAAARGVTL